MDSIQSEKTLFYCDKIEEVLVGLGFSNKMLGTSYCRCAMLFILKSEGNRVSVTKEVYPYVGKMFKVNAANVERNIRVAIEKAWMGQEIEKIRKYYPYVWSERSGRPTNSEFMYNVIAKILKTEECR